MSRLLGIATGSVIALGILIVALGLPELQVRGANPEAAIGPASETPATPKPLPAEKLPEQATKSDPEIVTAQLPDEPDAPAAESELSAPVEPPVAIEASPETNFDNWYAFWSPFRSEIAADGFITELQRTTGLDYRVIKLKPGVYEVAFAYSDETDIEDKLTRIAVATGLDLSGG